MKIINKKISRLEWIDVLKGFLLFCIVFSHFGYLPTPVAILIKPTGDIWIPAFFFISGILFNETRYPFFQDFFRSKLRSLLLPYLFFFLIFLLLDWNLYLKSENTIRSAGIALLSASGPPKAPPLWFVIKLFLINILYFFITRLSQKIVIRFILIFICSLAGYSLFLFGVHLPLGIDVLLSSVTFFGLGHLSSGAIFRSIAKLDKKSILWGGGDSYSISNCFKNSCFFQSRCCIGSQ